MHPICRSILFYLFLVSLSCSPAKKLASNGNNILPAINLNTLGRYTYNAQQRLALVSSAAHTGFSFKGTECKVFVSLANTGQHNFLQYTVDGIYKDNVRIEGKSDQPIIITAPQSGQHTVWLYKTTEAHTGPIYIEKIEANEIKALQIPKAPLIEFIGNSITCGAAADASVIPCGSGDYHDHHNAYQAYGPRVARALQANFTMSSVSGMGMYRNWNSDGPAMPQVYAKVDFQESNSEVWDFKKTKPAIISIALGTNDLSNGDGKRKRLPFDSAVFVNNYIKFVQDVKGLQPQAQIALLSSPMAGGKNRLLLQNCLSAVKQKIDALFPRDKPVALHFFQPMQARGCSGHPSVEDHEILANELIPFFKKLMSR